MVIAIVARAEELARFGDQAGHGFLVLLAHVQGVFAVGDNVDLVMDRLRREA